MTKTEGSLLPPTGARFWLCQHAIVVWKKHGPGFQSNVIRCRVIEEHDTHRAYRISGEVVEWA